MLSKSPFPLINPTLSFIRDPLFLVLGFAPHWCLFVFVFFSPLLWITHTEIAVIQILGHLPNPLGENIQITSLLSAIHSGRLFLILWLQRLMLLLIAGNLQQFSLLMYLCLLCRGGADKGSVIAVHQWLVASTLAQMFTKRLRLLL